MTGYLGPKKNPPTETIFWSNKKPERVGRQRSCDILPRSPQPSTLLPPAPGIESIRDAFHVLFTDEMTELVINNTNDKIRHIKENFPPHFVESNKNAYVRLLDQEEFYAFIGLLYARGLLGQSMHTYKILFSGTAGHQIFTFLNAVLTFDNPEEQRKLWKSDRFAAARRLTVMFNEQMKNVLVPSEYLSIDETLYSMRHQINFRQYNPNEPAKYGLLYKSLNDARFAFTCEVIP